MYRCIVLIVWCYFILGSEQQSTNTSENNITAEGSTLSTVDGQTITPTTLVTTITPVETNETITRPTFGTFEEILTSSAIIKPSIRVKEVTWVSPSPFTFYHVGVFIVIRSNQKFVIHQREYSESQVFQFLTLQIIEANKILIERFKVMIYLIDYIFVDNAFPGAGQIHIYENMTAVIQNKIGFPIVVIYANNEYVNLFQLTDNSTFNPCGPSYFHWNLQLKQNNMDGELSRLNFLMGNMIFRLYNQESSNLVCNNFNASCYALIASLNWTDSEIWYSTECLSQNIIGSYWMYNYTCFKDMPEAVVQSYCGNGVIEGKEKCDCHEPCDICTTDCIPTSPQTDESAFNVSRMQIAALGFAFMALLISGTFLILRDTRGTASYFGISIPGKLKQTSSTQLGKNRKSDPNRPRESLIAVTGEGMEILSEQSSNAMTTTLTTYHTGPMNATVLKSQESSIGKNGSSFSQQTESDETRSPNSGLKIAKTTNKSNESHVNQPKLKSKESSINQTKVKSKESVPSLTQLTDKKSKTK